MGPELALALALGGGAASMIGQRRQQKQRRAVLNRSLGETSKSQGKANELVQAEGRKFNPESRAADMAAQEQALFAQQQRDVGGAAIEPPTATGNVSDDFLKAKADKAISEGNRLTAVARELAKVRAPGQQMNEEGLRRADVAERTGSIWSTARNKANAAQLDADSIDEPWWGQLGKIAQAVGMTSLMGGAGGAGTAGVTGANGAFLGEGVASGVGGWDAALGAAPMAARSAAPGLFTKLARSIPRVNFGG